VGAMMGMGNQWWGAVGIEGVYSSGPSPAMCSVMSTPSQAGRGPNRDAAVWSFRQKVTGQRKKPERICVCEKILQAINKNVAPRHMPHKIHSAAVATIEEAVALSQGNGD